MGLSMLRTEAAGLLRRQDNLGSPRANKAGCEAEFAENQSRRSFWSLCGLVLEAQAVTHKYRRAALCV